MNKSTKQCPKCNRNITTNNYNRHVVACNIKATHKMPENGKFICDECNKTFELPSAIASHYWLSHTEEGKIHKDKLNIIHTNRKAWNKGLTKETDDRVKKCGITLSNRFKSGEVIPHMTGKHHTDATKQKLKINGGYRKGSGFGKSGRYKGHWCDSSWELAYVIYNIEHGIKFERNTKSFAYIFEGNVCKYIPDYIMDDEYIEIKGYENKKWKCKLSQFPHKLKVLKKNDMLPILEYVIKKYGKDFIKLYDK